MSDNELNDSNGSAIRELKSRIRNVRKLYAKSRTHNWGDFSHKEEADRLQRELSKLQHTEH